jgi:HEAT repeat protein
MTIFLAVVLAFGAAAQDSNPISVLQFDAPLVEKMDACRILSRQGTEEAIPVLAGLLLDEQLAHMARYALEPMPYPEAGAALRDALGKTSGLLKVGVISSLATRNDTEAVPALIALVPDSDAQVAQAAAKALGDIATPEAATGLESALGNAALSPATQIVICDALLGCAETYAAAEKKNEAVAIYDRLRELPDAPPFIATAALRGAILSRNVRDGVPIMKEALASDDADRFAMALRIARELDGKKAVAGALAETLPGLADDRKIQLMSVFGPGTAAAGPAVLAEAQAGATPVRIAALKAATRMEYKQVLPILEELSWAEDEDLAKAARDSLSYFPGNKGDNALKAMLKAENPEARRVGVELIGQGGVENPANLLLSVARQDTDETVRVAALTALQNSAGMDELSPLLERMIKIESAEERQAMEAVLSSISERQKKAPGGIVIEKAVYGDLPDGQSAEVTDQVKQIVESGSPTVEASNANFGDPAPGMPKMLRIDYQVHGESLSKSVNENDSLKLAMVSAPPAVVDAFSVALEKSEGAAKLGLIRLLGSTGSSKALDTVKAAAASEDPQVKDAALQTLCNWPSAEALPVIMDLTQTSTDPQLKLLALRGAVRLLGQSGADQSTLLSDYGNLLKLAKTDDEMKVVLAGLGQVSDKDALDWVFAQFRNETIKGEAVQAAINIARGLGASASEDAAFFNGKDLTGWQGSSPYWSVEDAAIVGRSDSQIPKNEFLWSNVEVGDFYLVMDVLLDPNAANAGIQFRSAKSDESGQAQGYQADIGETWWGKLYHEHGRGLLDPVDSAEAAVKPGEWNRYEILAVGPAIWTAINGTLGVAYLDLNENAERTGQIAVQLHSGPPMTARYRIVKLVHHPKVELENQKADDLIIKLRVSE